MKIFETKEGELAMGELHSDERHELYTSPDTEAIKSR
jgi:hypothetical protein